MSNELSQPVIVCAACLHHEIDKMIVGPKHWDGVMRQQLGHMQVVYNNEVKTFAGWIQGFIDQHGTFYDRRAAMIIAKAAGQKIDMRRNGPDPDVLYSEGLY